jgi:hypothetical protein
LILYNNDDDYLKFTYASNTGAVGRVFEAGCEAEGTLSSVFFPGYEGVEKVWLRVAKRGNRYAFSTSLDGKSFISQEYTLGDNTGRFRDDLTWGDGSVKRVGIFAKKGPKSTAPEVDASFDFFEVRSLSGKTGEAGEGFSSHEEEANVEARP